MRLMLLGLFAFAACLINIQGARAADVWTGIASELSCTVTTFSDAELLNLPWRRGNKLDRFGFAPCLNFKSPWYPAG